PLSVRAGGGTPVGRSVLAAGLLSFAMGYVVPMAHAFASAGAAQPLEGLTFPSFAFPTLRPPALPKAAAPARTTAGTPVRTVRSAPAPRYVHPPLSTNSYVTVPRQPKKAAAPPSPPTVEDSVGAPPLDSTSPSQSAAATPSPVEGVGDTAAAVPTAEQTQVSSS